MPLNINWQQILLHLLNFTILAFGLYFLLYRPVKKIIDKREKEYKDRDEKTKSALNEAESAKKEYGDKMAEAEKEAVGIKDAALSTAAKLSEEKKAEAKTEADRIIAEAKKKGESERKKIIEGADDDIKKIITEISDKIAGGSSVSDAYDEFLSAAEKSDEPDKNEADDGKN